MKLLRLEIQNFGTFHDYTLEFCDGLNMLCEENGWGKSTLAVFIKAMLYGLPATRKADLDLNERRKYAPWNGGAYGGSLEFECLRGKFRVERSFGAKEAKDTFRLFDLDTNTPSEAFGPELSIALFGIDSDGFERSAYLSERALDTKTENATVRAKLTGLIENPDDIGCYDDAQALIDKRRKLYEVKGGRGRISDLEAELRDSTRRLAELREKQTEQNALTDSLQRAENEVAVAEAALNRFQEARLAAEKQTSRRAQYASIQSSMRQKERRQAEIAGAFRDGRLPTEEEIHANRKLLAEYRNDQLAAQNARLSPEEQRRLDALDAKFRKGIPTAAEFDRADALERDLRDADAQLAALGRQQVTPAVQRLRQAGLPTQETLENAGRVIGRAEQLAAEERAPRLNTPAKRRIPLVVPLLALFCGIGLSVLALVPGLGLNPLMLGIGGGALLLVALTLFLLGGKPKEPAHAPQQETAASVLAPVLSMLAHYGLHREGGNPREELAQLSILCEQARAYEESMKQTERRHAALTAKRSSARAGLDDFFAAYGITPPTEDLPRALARLRSDAETLTVLRRNADTLLARRTELEAALTKERNTIQAFFSRLTAVRAGNAPEDCQEQIERLCMESRQNTTDLTAIRQRADAFYRENRALLDAPAEPVGSDAGLRSTLEEARTRAQKLRADRNRLADQTAEIPALNDRIAALQEETAKARAALEVLRHTAEYLEKAKDALSTRYLGGMQKAFEARLERLGQATGIRAVIDPQLSVSVRDGATTRELASASRGTRDLLTFCARLALTEVLSADGEKPFLLLDDPFVNFDEVHLRAALAYLHELGRDTQILYLVCHTSRTGAAPMKGTHA